MSPQQLKSTISFLFPPTIQFKFEFQFEVEVQLEVAIMELMFYMRVGWMHRRRNYNANSNPLKGYWTPLFARVKGEVYG